MHAKYPQNSTSRAFTSQGPHAGMPYCAIHSTISATETQNPPKKKASSELYRDSVRARGRRMKRPMVQVERMAKRARSMMKIVLPRVRRPRNL